MTSKNTRRVKMTPAPTPPEWLTEELAADDNSPETLKRKAARAISRALTTSDLRHPKAPQGALIIPWMRAEGHPNPEVADAIKATATMLGEALVDKMLNELGAQLITSADLRQLLNEAVNQPVRAVTLNCRHGELLQLGIKPGTNTVDVNCHRLRQNLKQCTSKPTEGATNATNAN